MLHALLLVLLLVVLPAISWLVNEQYQSRPRVQVRLGHSFMTGRDCELFIGWRRGEGAPGYSCYQRSVELTWDWLPRCIGNAALT